MFRYIKKTLSLDAQLSEIGRNRDGENQGKNKGKLESRV